MFQTSDLRLLSKNLLIHINMLLPHRLICLEAWESDKNLIEVKQRFSLPPLEIQSGTWSANNMDLDIISHVFLYYLPHVLWLTLKLLVWDKNIWGGCDIICKSIDFFMEHYLTQWLSIKRMIHIGSVNTELHTLGDYWSRIKWTPWRNGLIINMRGLA